MKKHEKISSPNSPFDDSTFSLRQAQRWVRKGKADIVGDRLVFRTTFAEAVRNQNLREEREDRDRVSFEETVDTQRGGPTVGFWSGGAVGSPSAAGSPQFRVMKMQTKLAP